VLPEGFVDFLCKPRQPWRWLVRLGRAYAWFLTILIALIALSLTLDVARAFLF
jgi:hypothetical protein